MDSTEDPLPHLPHPEPPADDEAALTPSGDVPEADAETRPRRWPFFQIFSFVALGLVLLAVAALLEAHHWLRTAATASLPQIDGQVAAAGLGAPVTVLRDGHGVPHIRAGSMDDLVFGQGYVTAQDRLWQMETLRRHAAGTLAEVLGKGLIAHDQAQRTLQIRAAADVAATRLPADQMHWLEVYARGVNASMEAQRAHLPVEFRMLRFQPAPWTPRDSLLVGLAMFEDLTNTFPAKLGREAISAKLPPELMADLYPVGSWRDHPPGQPVVDLTVPGPEIPAVPLDESQIARSSSELISPEHTRALLAAVATLAPVCEGCRAGSNNWVVAGAKTATGKPLLSNDMHLGHGVPGIWYEADLKAGAFHAAGVTLPGTPFVIVGHNDHVAWGFTNLGADVQDLTIEHIRGTGLGAQFQAADGSWERLLYRQETIHVHGERDVVLDLPLTRHGALATPIVSGLYPGERRAISLRWTIEDPGNLTSPFFGIDSAADGAGLCAAFALFGGPAQNMVYADDQGHIGYHAVGQVPLRGDPAHPSPPAPVPTDAGSAANEWSGQYIPFEQLPQVADPPGGVIATANARVTLDGYAYPVTLDWAAPYRNERIWKVLGAKWGLTPVDMLTLQTDVHSDLDQVIAQKLAYAIDHARLDGKKDGKRLHQAADLLRHWDGQVGVNAPAAAIVDAARTALWPLLLTPRLGETAKLYSWGEKAFAEEQLVMHTPARWLPAGYAGWDDLLADAVDKGLAADHAPTDLATWSYGRVHPVEIEHPIFATTPLVGRLLGMRTGTGALPQSGDTTTVKQVGRTFGPSERFTANLADLDRSTLNLVLGQSGDPASPWFLDQFPAWYMGTTYLFPYTETAVKAVVAHTLTLTPR